MLPQYGLRVSMLLDANGANTTAAAAVRAVVRHLPLPGVPTLVLGGTGPVGQRVALLLAREGAEVRLASRSQDRAAAAVSSHPGPPARCSSRTGRRRHGGRTAQALRDRVVVIAAGAAGVVLLPAAERAACTSLEVVIDLNAVPPLGVEGVQLGDKGAPRDGVVYYGALGVGETKMKVHRAAIASLFESNDRVLDAVEVYELAKAL